MIDVLPPRLASLNMNMFGKGWCAAKNLTTAIRRGRLSHAPSDWRIAKIGKNVMPKRAKR
jgi:hypothetical protein